MSSIAYITLSAIPSHYANSVQVVNMASALQCVGHDVVLYAPYAGVRPGPATLRDFYGVPEGIVFEPLRRYRLRGATHAFVVRAVRRAWSHADLTYTRSVEAAFYSTLAGQPTVIELHAPVAAFRPAQRLMLRRVLRSRHLRRIVVISEYLRSDFMARAPHCSVLVAPDGANVSEAPVPAPNGDATHRLSVGYAGSLYRGRGMDTILALAERCEWADFHIYGGSSDQVREWGERARRLPNIRWHGMVAPARVQAALADCDVLIAPYERAVYTASDRLDTSPWMSPLKVFEYMAAGRAIICSDLPAIREVLSHDVTALLCDPDGTESWTAALDALRGDPHLRSRLGREAFSVVRSQYSWPARGKQVLSGLP